MRQDGRTDPRTPYAEEYRNRRGFAETIQDHGTRIKNVELRANQVPLLGEQAIEVRLNGIPVGTENILDFIEGANVTLTVSDDGQVIHIEIAASGTSSSGYDTIEDEGAPLPQRTTIDFVGAGVTAADAGGVTVVTIPGGSSTGYDTIEDEGTPLAQETILDFQGAGVVASAGAGKTIITIPGASSSGGGVFAADAVVAPNCPDPDGTPTTLATGEIVLMYTTPQAAYDAYANGDFPRIGTTRAVIRLNRNEDVGSPPDLDMSAAVGAVYLMGEAPRAIEAGVGAPVILGTVSIVDPDTGAVMENLAIYTELVASGASANDQGMLLQLTNVSIDFLTGGVRGLSFSPASMRNVTIGTWLIDAAHQATANVHARFDGGYVGQFSDDGNDAVIAGIYSFVDWSFNGIFFVVGTDKHFAFAAECHLYNNMEFQMDGGTLTLDLDAFHLHSGARIVITDVGGGGTVIINWSGGSVEQTAAPVIEADATIVVTGSVDGVALLGTPNSPAFKGQFVDFTFGDAISPPSYVVEFL